MARAQDAARTSGDPTVLSRVQETEELVREELRTMFAEIHAELGFSANNGEQRHQDRGAAIEGVEAAAKFYFDGQGKAVRPSIAMTVGHAFNCHRGVDGDQEVRERDTDSRAEEIGSTKTPRAPPTRSWTCSARWR